MRKMNHNVVGQKIGYLTVLSNPETINGKKYRCWVQCDCGIRKAISFYTLTRPSPVMSCGCKSFERCGFMRGERHHLWKGGKKKMAHGYVAVLLREHYPDVQAFYPDTEYLQEHIAIMSRKYKRRLFPKETVHHKNGLRDDNRIENLELWSSNHPPGQRVEDLLTWAKEILDLYSSQTSFT